MQRLFVWSMALSMLACQGTEPTPPTPPTPRCPEILLGGGRPSCERDTVRVVNP
jgi:hypothetical protein